jgi:hypothetical protein
LLKRDFTPWKGVGQRIPADPACLHAREEPCA